MTVIVDGNKIAQSLQHELQQVISQESLHISFHLVYVGSDPVIDNFVRYKTRFGNDIGVEVKLHRFKSNIDQQVLINKMKNIATIADAMIVQLPLPEHLDTQVILDAVPPHKDVDVLSTEARMQFKTGDTKLIPPVTGAIVQIFESYNVDLNNKNITLIGDGSLVGRPMMMWLDRAGYMYDVVNKNTDKSKAQSLLENADIIISGAGSPHLVCPPLVKYGAVLIDAGTSEAGKKILGDIHPDSFEKASLVTPVPGGIGPVTIAILYQNILSAYQSAHE